MQNWIDAGPALVDWLLRQPEVDAQKIGVTVLRLVLRHHHGCPRAAHRRDHAGDVHLPREPRCHTIFEELSPTFKKRYMWMANYTDEGKFDEFVKTLTWEGHAEKIRGPYLVVAGEDR